MKNKTNLLIAPVGSKREDRALSKPTRLSLPNAPSIQIGNRERNFQRCVKMTTPCFATFLPESQSFHSSIQNFIAKANLVRTCDPNILLCITSRDLICSNEFLKYLLKRSVYGYKSLNYDSRPQIMRSNVRL